MFSALPALPSGTVVLVDANIFVYGFLGESQQCAAAIERCRNEDVVGVTTIEVINEVCHRLMLREAFDSGLISRPAAAALRSKKDAIRGLRRYWELTSQILHINLIILAADQARQHSAHRVRTEHGLLTNDSLIVAACQDYGIRLLASRDDDFDAISGLTVYKPTDLT